MRQPNFEQCGKDYMANATAQALFGWRGPVIGIAPNNQSQVTTEGCKILCGTYSDYYPWSLASSTITTWILPVVGILLQAPFESNAFSHTILAIARWVGSPMASLAYILWNIKVSAKCALMVDMATRCDEPIPDEQSHFSSIRDSFYILMTMNQYTMRRSEALNKEAEGLLRIVLFSKDLQLRGKDGKEKRLNKVRQDLAHKLRAAPDDIRKKLNKLIDIVCKSLQDEEIREDFIGTFEGQPECKRMEAWVRRISEQSKYMQDFFVDFAGQGRVRWHYGAAHPILSDIEDSQHLFIKATLPILRSAGTAVGTAIMSFSMMYVVSEWCQQSHLSTENYAAAARGLHRTRAYRRLTYPLRLAWRTLEAATFLLLKAVLVTVFRRPDGPRADNSVRWTPDGASPRVPSFGSSTTTGGGSDGGAAMLGVTPSIQLEEWTDAHLHHSPPRHRTHDRYRSISLDTDPLSTADSQRFSPPYFPGSRSRSRSRGESDASSRALLGG
ncbi:putative glutamine-dependent nad(+) synthetase protein [Neofusicoccum parvum UCRNP2]|uniref:Putative glutamine-dependent nad(+) synthetase protein n=1 Tax=Botryosphaeria parva (strain UCR-NP2) TaxID=1287680 RepID=R1H1Z8_BOTPV|nr:putative glutamine-dependent nad(+) synthetase protein [Neofusicoccum parvum UCRNP2]